MSDKLLDKVHKQDARRAEREKHLRVVYSYRRKGDDFVTDNLLLLPKSTEMTHERYLEHAISCAMLADANFKPDNFVGLDVVRVGLYNVQKNTFTPKPVTVVIDVYGLACRAERIGNSK